MHWHIDECHFVWYTLGNLDFQIEACTSEIQVLIGLTWYGERDGCSMSQL